MVASTPEILHTKLAIPITRADRVPRPRLSQKLTASLERPLTVICAPAGFGKTTLITDWHDQLNRPHFPLAWLSIDEDDNDPTRFLIYLVAAIGTVHADISEALLGTLQSPQPPHFKSFLTLLLNHVGKLPSRFALVLDDYHLITAQPIHDMVTFLLDHLTSQMNLIVTSRADPPLPLGRLRARDQMVEIRADDLRFISEETNAFLQYMLSIELPLNQINALGARTEGWIAGLQLAALAMQGHDDIPGFIAAFTGSHRYILEYLTDEVLSRQPESLQRFLMQTSILSRLSGSLCNAVTGNTDGQVLLEQVERSNLFLMPLDDEHYWYRYHHLFGDMLRRRLHQSLTIRVPELHHRASEWFETSGWVTEAIEHAFLSQDRVRAAQLVERYGERLWMRGEVATFLRWLRMLPQEILKTHPKLCLNYAFVLTIIDAHNEAEHYLLEAEQALLQEEQSSQEEHSALLGVAAVIRTTISFQLEYDADIIIASGHKSLALLPEAALVWRSWIMVVLGCTLYASKGEMAEAESCLKEAIKLGENANNPATVMPALMHLSRMYIIQGRLKKAEITANMLFDSASETVYRGQARLNRSKVLYERDDLNSALNDAIEGWEDTRDHSLRRMSLDGYVMLARLKQIQGEEAEGRALMQQAVQIVESGKLKQTFIPLTAWQAWLYLVQGDLVAAEQWAQEVVLTTQRHLSPALEFEHMTLARIQIAQGRLDEAEEFLARLFSAAKSAGRMGRVIAICVLQALAAKLQGNHEQALTALEYALSLAEPEGYVRTFVDEGVLMAELLRDAHKQGIAQSYVAKLLTAFDPQALPTVAAERPQQGTGDDGESLSEREIEVLRLMAEGASNREIAEQLVVSLGTVKKHLNNLFLKFDAHSRTQAIATARSQKLL